ncbi:MAG: hypothetical protein IT204_00635 [Fimbriimonadaceae bacterium]|nr:hypothetical protein [Fimbriimonadaceae bacterium]
MRLKRIAMLSGWLLAAVAVGCSSGSALSLYGGEWLGAWQDAEGDHGAIELTVQSDNDALGRVANLSTPFDAIETAQITGTVDAGGAVDLTYWMAAATRQTAVGTLFGNVRLQTTGEVSGNLQAVFTENPANPVNTAVVLWRADRFPWTGTWSGNWRTNTNQQGTIALEVSPGGIVEGTMAMPVAPDMTLTGEVLGQVDYHGTARLAYRYVGFPELSGTGNFVRQPNGTVTGDLTTTDGSIISLTLTRR